MTALPGLAPPASLRLRRPVWGIDPSVRGIALGALYPEGEVGVVLEEPAPVRLGWWTIKLPLGPDAPVHVRWWEAMRVVGPEVSRLAGLWGVPELVLLEQPFSQGHSTEPASYFAVATVLVALGRHLGPASRVELINPGAWKKPATGHGYAPGLPKSMPKAEKRRQEKSRLLTWAYGAGYSGSSSDEADAVGIATAAGVLLELEREALR